MWQPKLATRTIAVFTLLIGIVPCQAGVDDAIKFGKWEYSMTEPEVVQLPRSVHLLLLQQIQWFSNRRTLQGRQDRCKRRDAALVRDMYQAPSYDYFGVDRALPRGDNRWRSQ